VTVLTRQLHQLAASSALPALQHKDMAPQAPPYLPGVSRGNGASPAGETDGSSKRRNTYQALLKSIIEAHKRYPLAARKSGREGTCKRRFVLGRNGSLINVEALSSCGHAFLDESATRAITEVSSFPPLPDEFKGTEATFTIDITFKLNAKRED